MLGLGEMNVFVICRDRAERRGSTAVPSCYSQCSKGFTDQTLNPLNPSLDRKLVDFLGLYKTGQQGLFRNIL